MKKDAQEIRQIIEDALQGKIKQDAQVLDGSHIVRDLGLDSVAVMDFVMELEDRLDISVPLDRMAEIETVSDLVGALGQLQQAG